MHRRTLIAAGVLMLLAASFVFPRPAPADDDADIAAKIASAKTAADHEAIAAYYDHEAAEARENAERHEKMGEGYKKAGGPFLKTHLHEHCEALVKSYQSEAKMFAQMAAGHREMAKNAK